MALKKSINGTRLLNCPNFSSASDEEKREIFLRVKNKCKELCLICTNWMHDSSKCNVKSNCNKCKSIHIKGACALQ